MGAPVILEICADSVESAVAAERGGADRIELCSSLLEGGVTPSAGLISTVRSRLNIDLYVMIRPRGGDFCYTSEEFETMEQDARTAKQLGANGIVFGILQKDGRVDMARTRRLVDVVQPLKVTFHRAFDMSRDLDQALEDVIAAGVDRVLTSGGEQKVEDGMALVQKLNRAAQGRVVIMAGGGISESNVHRVLAATQVKEFHAAVRAHISSPMRHRNEKISMGLIKGREYERVVVLQDRVRRLLAAAMDGSRASAKAR